ncbi:zinc-binding protein [bacterium]|nr:zinc-binding protein [bacterium]
MNEKTACMCGEAPTLIFPCSGGSDVGCLADQAARKLTKDGVGRMYCLAGIGGRVPGIIETTKAAAAVLAIDGCPVDCAKKTLEQAGFSGFKHLRLSDIGLEKGRSPVTFEAVHKVADHAAKRVTR